MHRPLSPSLAHHLLKSILPATIPISRAFGISTHLQQKRMGIRLSRGATKDDAGVQPEPDLIMIVGLGNPGPRYENTRHNVGFMTIDALARQIDVKTDRLQANCAVGRGRLFHHKLLLVKPMTFMNVSGEGIGKLSRYYCIPSDRILVIYDDLDTPTGVVRMRKKGGHGGHNGVRSTIQHLGTQEFSRCKIGIARPPEGMPVASYVLQDFSAPEREKIDEAVLEAVEAAKAFVVLGGEKAVSGQRIDAQGSQVSKQQPPNATAKKTPANHHHHNHKHAKHTVKGTGSKMDTENNSKGDNANQSSLGAALMAAAAAQQHQGQEQQRQE